MDGTASTTRITLPPSLSRLFGCCTTRRRRIVVSVLELETGRTTAVLCTGHEATPSNHIARCPNQATEAVLPTQHAGIHDRCRHAMTLSFSSLSMQVLCTPPPPDHLWHFPARSQHYTWVSRSGPSSASGRMAMCTTDRVLITVHTGSLMQCGTLLMAPRPRGARRAVILTPPKRSSVSCPVPAAL